MFWFAVTRLTLFETTCSDIDLFFCFTDFFHFNLMSKDGIKKTTTTKRKKPCPGNANASNIAHLLSWMVRMYNVCNILKLDTHERLNIVRIILEIISKLYFRNNQETIVTSANEIEIKFI